MQQAIDHQVGRLGELLLQRQWLLTTAESCTAGGLGYAITRLSGSSRWYYGGWITYANAAKIHQLDVAPALLDSEGAVSEAVALAMAKGALRRSGCDCALAITGIAGPTGAVPGKPVGTVCFGLAFAEARQLTSKCQFPGSREAVREAAILYALQWLEENLLVKAR